MALAGMVQVMVGESQTNLVAEDSEKEISFEKLCERVGTGCQQNLQEIVLTLNIMSEALRAYASRAADMVVTPEQEYGKRTNITFWREEAARLDVIANAVAKVAVSGESLRNEIREMLLTGVKNFEAGGAQWDGLMLRAFCAERAANIAQAFRDRVLPE